MANNRKRKHPAKNHYILEWCVVLTLIIAGIFVWIYYPRSEDDPSNPLRPNNGNNTDNGQPGERTNSLSVGIILGVLSLLAVVVYFLMFRKRGSNIFSSVNLRKKTMSSKAEIEEAIAKSLSEEKENDNNEIISETKPSVNVPPVSIPPPEQPQPQDRPFKTTVQDMELLKVFH